MRDSGIARQRAATFDRHEGVGAVATQPAGGVHRLLNECRKPLARAGAPGQHDEQSRLGTELDLLPAPLRDELQLREVIRGNHPFRATEPVLTRRRELEPGDRG